MVDGSEACSELVTCLNAMITEGIQCIERLVCMTQQVVMFRRRERKARKGAIDGVHKDICSLL